MFDLYPIQEDRICISENYTNSPSLERKPGTIQALFVMKSRLRCRFMYQDAKKANAVAHETYES